MRLTASAAAVVPIALLAAACSVYDASLLGTGGATHTAASASGSGGAGGASPCTAATDCPGQDDDCQQRACADGVCRTTFTAAGTAITMQTPGDCQKVVCDGMGATVSQNDDTDVPNDGNACTNDTCSGGNPREAPAAAESPCAANGGKVCDGNGTCVECVQSTDCPSGICTQMVCEPASCGDGVKNGSETDIDCGGTQCLPCATGKGCLVPSDCVGGVCTANKCSASCSDGVKDNGETDVDCGGPNCGPCAYGDSCSVNADCATLNCAGGTCACPGSCACNHLVISEIRSRGSGGASDEFIELYNPTSWDVTLNTSWKIEARSATGTSYSTRWTGNGVVIPVKGHALIAGSAYAQSPAPDGILSVGISDAASVRLTYSGGVVDAVCYAYSTATTADLEVAGFTCEGTPMNNLPHNDGTGGASNSDASIERKPGGASGNCQDTGDNATDFQNIAPARPQSTQSPPT